MGFGESLGVGEWLVIGLSILIGLWFLIGNWINNQRSDETMRWLKKGVSVFGQPGRAQFSAPNAKGIRLKIEPPQQSPLKNLEGNLVLQRRENLPIWGYQFLRGKQDTLQLTADVRPGPDGEIHAFHKSNLAPVEASRRGEIASLTPIQQDGDIQYFSRGESNPEQFHRISRLAETYPGLFLEISVQRKSPNLTLQVRLSSLLRVAPQEFFQALNKVFNGQG